LELIKAQKLLEENSSRGKSKRSITNIFKQSSMLYLWLISGVLGYASKIPFIKQIIGFLSLWYGRTTWWNLLVKIRKLFIVFNALIGVFMVFKTIGFSTDNLFAGFSAMGHTYVEIFYNFTKRMFHWFVELFDHKVVPNLPGEGPTPPKTYPWSNGKLWGSTPPATDVLSNFSLRELYKTPSINVSIDTTPWYKDFYSWLKIGGIICSIGAIYFGYKFIFDPLFIENMNNSGTATVRPSPIDPNMDADITLTDRVTNVTKYLGNTISSIKSKLNPFNWLAATSGINNNNLQTFIERQNHMETADRTLYPFTAVNPYLPWYQQLKIQLFGESISESLQRFKARTYAERIYNSLQVSKGKFTAVEGLTPVITPSNWIGSVGVGVNTPTTGFNLVDTIHSVNVETKLNSLTPTPRTVPTINPKVYQEIGEWDISRKDPNVPMEHFSEAWKLLKNPPYSQIASGSKITLEEIITNINNK
jgi:hypothetical protein